MLRTLDRYLFREVLLSWLAVTGILLTILVTHQLAAMLERAAESRFSSEVVLTLIGFSTLENLTLLGPVGLLLAVILGFGRLYHDSEMTAIQACGVGPRRLYVPVMVLTVILATVLTWLALELSPRAASQVMQLRAVAVRDAQFVNLEPGRFRSLGEGNAVFYAAGVDPDGTLREVFVKRNRGERLEITAAARARHYISEDGGTHTFVLEDGRLYEGVPGSREFRITRFQEQGIPVRLPEARADSSKLDQKPTAQLLASTDPADTAELQWRISMPLMALVLGFIAVPLARLRPRQGRYARVGYAILVYFAYFQLLSMAKVWVARGVLPPEVGLWWIHVLMAVLAVVLLVRK